ncbi:sortase [Patescibacteria group bacterium]
MPQRKNKAKNSFDLVIKLGLLFVALAVCGGVLVFGPVIVKEIGFLVSKPSVKTVVTASESDSKALEDVIVAVDKEFAVIVPKINANSKVVKDVDPYSSKVYQQELTKGVAHAKGTVLPGEVGNSFYFAHSSDNFYNANRYNSVFYLLRKMEPGDSFFLVYEGEIYEYKVLEVKIVNGESVEYLEGSTDKKLATLMTCWPPGTTIERLIVLGELIE